jgi:nicotinamidase-related amidase
VAAAGGAVVRVAHARPARAPRGVADPTPLGAPPGDQVHAAGIDGFYGSDLDARLRAAGRTQLLVCGHGLEGPVHSTLRSANDRGLECLLVVDACSPLQPDLVAGATSSVCMSGGIFGAVGRTDAVLAALEASR